MVNIDLFGKNTHTHTVQFVIIDRSYSSLSNKNSNNKKQKNKKQKNKNYVFVIFHSSNIYSNFPIHSHIFCFLSFLHCYLFIQPDNISFYSWIFYFLEKCVCVHVFPRISNNLIIFLSILFDFFLFKQNILLLIHNRLYC